MIRQLNQEIINYLNHQTDFVSSEQIAVALDVSKATVVRRVANINAKNYDFDGPTILSERGRGYKLNSNYYLSIDSRSEESTREERCNEVIKELLFVAPKRLRTFDLYEKYYVSEAVIDKDRLLISEKLKKWHLKLNRSNKHIAITGSEKDIRAAIMGIVLNLNKRTDISDLEEYCKGINNATDFLFTMQQIEYASTALGIVISYPYNISLFAHVYVLLDRVRLYRHISSHNKIPSVLKEEKMVYPEIYSVCKKIIDNIGDYTGIVPDSSEVIYLFVYLSTARISNKNDDKIEISQSRQIADSYIYKVSQILEIQFSNELHAELEKHIKYLIQRLSKHIYLPNALLNDIKVEYGDIYNAVNTVSKDISVDFNLPFISEDESGFISLYFAKYLELERESINVYIVCTTGIGTSELIAVKIRKSFPMINIVGITSSVSISKVVECIDERIDLVITTIPIQYKLEIPTVLVSSILTSRDIEAINQTIEEISNGR